MNRWEYADRPLEERGIFLRVLLRVMSRARQRFSRSRQWSGDDSMGRQLKNIDLSTDQTKELRRGLGRWLKQKREEANLTQVELAKRLGFDFHTGVSHVENGAGRIPQSLYEKWANELNVPPHVFAMTILEHLEPGLYALIDQKQLAPIPKDEGKVPRTRVKSVK